MAPEIKNWASFTQAIPEFVDVFRAAFRAIPQLVLDTTPADGDDAGLLVCELMTASISDLDDIMLLCCKDQHWGAFKLLRGLFERTVTLKYLVQNPKEVGAFLAFDALDSRELKFLIRQIDEYIQVTEFIKCAIVYVRDFAR